jgi:hypothetical protein
LEFGERACNSKKQLTVARGFIRILRKKILENERKVGGGLFSGRMPLATTAAEGIRL